MRLEFETGRCFHRPVSRGLPQNQSQHANLTGVIRVVQRHAEQLTSDRLIAGGGNSRELLRRRVANRLEKPLVGLLEEPEVRLPFGGIRPLRRHGPPRLSNRTGKRIDVAIERPRRQQVPPVCQVQHELPNRVPLLRRPAKRGGGIDALERFEHRWSVPGRTSIRFRERAENQLAVGISGRFAQWSYR